MYSSTDLPLPEPKHLHPGLHRKLAAKRVPIDAVYDCGETLIVYRERGGYTHAAPLILLLLSKRTPLRPTAHEILRKNEPTVLTNGLTLIEVLNEIHASTLWTNVNSRRVS